MDNKNLILLNSNYNMFCTNFKTAKQIRFNIPKFLAPFFSNVLLASSLNTISNGACKLFSTPQCFLTASANE